MLCLWEALRHGCSALPPAQWCPLLLIKFGGDHWAGEGWEEQSGWCWVCVATQSSGLELFLGIPIVTAGTKGAGVWVGPFVVQIFWCSVGFLLPFFPFFSLMKGKQKTASILTFVYWKKKKEKTEPLPARSVALKLIITGSAGRQPSSYFYGTFLCKTCFQLVILVPNFNYLEWNFPCWVCAPGSFLTCTCALCSARKDWALFCNSLRSFFVFFSPLSSPQVKQTIPPFYKQSVGLNSPYLHFGRGWGRTS